MVKFSQERLNVWMYKYLLGILSIEEIENLKLELEIRNRENQINSALERKFLVAFIQKGKEPREYLAELIEDWGKRNWCD